MSAPIARHWGTSWAVLCATLLLTAHGRLAQAHHSFAMFDNEKNVTLSGTVREFQFTNPHCFIQLLVPKADGSGTVEWSIEMSTPAHLVGSGWTRNTVKPGDKISVIVHPLKDGTQGGSFVSATNADGHTL